MIADAAAAAKRPFTFKILVSGIYAAGKTSLIKSISQTAVVSTDVRTSGTEADVKATTTVAMDFGTFRLDSDPPIRLMLFGTPGQSRFRFMVEILKKDIDVIAFVVNSELDDHSEAQQMLAALQQGEQVPVVIAVNRCESVEQARDVARQLGADDSVPAIPCQLVDPQSGRQVIISVLMELLSWMERNDREAAT